MINSEWKKSCTKPHHEDDVVGDHVDPASEALVGDELHEGRLPLEDEVDDEASEDPVEAALEHLRRVQHAEAEVQRAVGVEGGLPRHPSAPFPFAMQWGTFLAAYTTFSPCARP